MKFEFTGDLNGKPMILTVKAGDAREAENKLKIARPEFKIDSCRKLQAQRSPFDPSDEQSYRQHVMWQLEAMHASLEESKESLKIIMYIMIGWVAISFIGAIIYVFTIFSIAARMP